MLSECVNNGAPDNERTRGMVTSLWYNIITIKGNLKNITRFAKANILVAQTGALQS